MGDPRVLARKERDLAVLEVAAQRRPEHLAHHEHLAGLLLRDRVRLEPNTECGQGRRAIRAAEVVALPAAAVVDDRLASMGVANRRQPLGDLANGGVPVDLLERSVRSSTKRCSAAAHRARSGSSRGAAPSRRCSPSTPGGPCRPGSVRRSVRRRPRGPRPRSCTRTGCRRSDATRPPAAPRFRRSSLVLSSIVRSGRNGQGGMEAQPRSSMTGAAA